MKLKNKLIFLLILQLGNIYPVIMSLSIFQNGNKRILVIGNQHATNRVGQVIEDDQADAKIVFNWVENLKSTISFLIEYPSFITHKQVISNDAKYIGLCNQLPRWAMKHNFKYHNLSFILEDIRGPKYSQVRFVTDYFRDKKLKIQVEDITIEEFFEEILANAQILFEKMKDLPEEQLYVLQLYRIFQEQYLMVKNFFAKFAPDSSLTQVIINSMLFNLDKYRRFFRTYSALGCCMADMGLILQLIKLLENVDNVVIYTGNEHAKTMVHYLRACKYAEIYCQGRWERVTGQYEGRVFNSNELEEILNIAFGSTKQLNKLCANCKQKEGSWRCGTCKAAWYCSLGCQKTHWELHKLGCKK